MSDTPRTLGDGFPIGDTSGMSGRPDTHETRTTSADPMVASMRTAEFRKEIREVLERHYPSESEIQRDHQENGVEREYWE